MGTGLLEQRQRLQPSDAVHHLAVLVEDHRHDTAGLDEHLGHPGGVLVQSIRVGPGDRPGVFDRRRHARVALGVRERLRQLQDAGHGCFEPCGGVAAGHVNLEVVRRAVEQQVDRLSPIQRHGLHGRVPGTVVIPIRWATRWRWWPERSRRHASPRSAARTPASAATARPGLVVARRTLGGCKRAGPELVHKDKRRAISATTAFCSTPTSALIAGFP